MTSIPKIRQTCGHATLCAALMFLLSLDDLYSCIVDQDQDGVIDVIEVYQGTDPASGGDLSTFKAMATDSDDLCIQYRRNTAQTHITGSDQWSLDLVEWHDPADIKDGVSVSFEHVVTASGPDYEVIETTIRQLSGEPTSIFYRKGFVDSTPMPAMTIEDNNAFLMAMGCGARIEIHAADSQKASWVQIAHGHTADPGDNQITVDNGGTPTGWESGDRIAIATSYYHPERTEERTITNIVEGNPLSTITLNQPLQFIHNGEIETYSMGEGASQRSWDVDMRAEVALLSRNVVVQGDADSQTDRFGGHIMVMMMGKMHVAGAEFRFMGQDGVLARYPLHWHRSGDVSGQYIRNNSIHHSYHKGITVHGTNRAWVANNVIFDTLGHGIFLENGSEEDNVIKANLVFNQREAVNPVIASDKFAVASYWSNNPKNHFLYNHAAGARGSGFWIAGNRTVIADLHARDTNDELIIEANSFPINGHPVPKPEYEGYVPRQLPFGLFVGNSAHSNLKTDFSALGREMTGMGLNIGQEITNEENVSALVHDNYAELHQPKSDTDNDIHNLYVSDFTAYMNEDVGLFGRTFGGHFTGLKLADNQTALMTTGGQLIEDSVIIGHSQNGRAAHSNDFKNIRDARYGLAYYTDSVVVDETLFSNFGDDQDDEILTQRFGANNSTLHIMRDVEIANTDVDHYFMSNGKNNNRRSDELGVSTVGFVDESGAFTGSPGSMVMARLRPAENDEDNSSSATAEILVPGFHRAPYTTVNAGVLNQEDALDAHVSAYQTVGHLKILRSSQMKIVTRSDGPQIKSTINGTQNQAIVYAHKDSSYGSNPNVSYTIEWEAGMDADLGFVIREFARGQQVHLILKDVPTNTKVQSSDAVGSFSALTTRDPLLGSAHWWDGADLHLMLSATYESYRPQVGDLGVLNHRVYWDDVRVRLNGTSNNTGEGQGEGAWNHKNFRPFSTQLEPDFGDQVDWRTDPIEFLPPTVTQEDMLAIVDSLDPDLVGSTSQTVAQVSHLPRWSEPSTWGGTPPNASSIVVIKAGQKVVLDEDAEVKGIIIAGNNSALIIEDDPNKTIQLTSDYVLAVKGALFQAGTETDLLDTQFTLELSGDDPALVLPVSDIVNDASALPVVFAQ